MVDVLERVSVGGREITAADIAAEAQNHPAEDPETAWAAAAEALVIRQLLLDEAERLGVVAASLTDAEGRTLAPDDSRIEALLEQEVMTPKADATTTRRYYDQHRQRFTSPTIVEAEHILFSVSPDDGLARGIALSDARQAIAAISANPACFAEIARAQSACPSREHGGKLGQIGPGQTVEEFEAVLFALGENELHPKPVRTRFGVHVIRAGRRIEGRLLPYDAVSEKIAAFLEEASWRRAVSQYLAILAAQTEIVGVALTSADGPLVQ